MPIVQQGSINTTALVVPDLYVQIVPPQALALNGVPTDIVGVVGSASWGPVGQPVIVGSMSDYAVAFGPVMTRKYDMGTQVATAVLQGAQNFRCVRATDGTDTAASLTVPTVNVVFTATYTGTLGNQIAVALTGGSKAGTWRLTVTLPGLVPEVFDNIAGSGTAFWQALAAAVNAGQGPQRGPSALVTANANGASAAPVAFAYSFATGTPGSDGAAGVAAAMLVGVDAVPRKGMYALRGQGCSIALLADADDATQWTTQEAFGLSEGIYMILTGPAGDNIANAVAAKQTAGLDSYACKLMFGDWIWWNDPVNATLRVVSPQGFVAGRLGAGVGINGAVDVAPAGGAAAAATALLREPIAPVKAEKPEAATDACEDARVARAPDWEATTAEASCSPPRRSEVPAASAAEPRSEAVCSPEPATAAPVARPPVAAEAPAL